MKQTIPDANLPATKELKDLTKEELSDKLSSFKEVLKNANFKDLDAYSLLGLDKPVPVKSDAEINQAKIAEIMPKFEALKTELVTAGYQFPTESKMSDGEKAILKKVEQQGVAKFAEQKQDLLKSDKDFPVDIIEKLEVPIEGKIAVMTAAREIVSRNSEAITTLKKELDVANAQIKEAKMMAPKEQEGDKTGAEKVKASKAKFGIKDDESEE